MSGSVPQPSAPSVGWPGELRPFWRGYGRRSRAGSLGVLGPARDYFASDSRRGFQTALGLLWLLDAALQFQPYMYSSGFIGDLTGNASGQPHWLGSTITWAGNLAGRDLTLFNTLFALTQVAIGLGLLYRRTVKPALVLSIVWALIVWWAGEGFGFLLAGYGATANPQVYLNSASPLLGAPGPAVLYALIAMMVWPGQRPGGLLGVRGARIAWAVLWVGMAALWLAPINSSANASYSAIMMAPAGMNPPSGMAWLNRLEGSASIVAAGHGLEIAIVFAVISLAIGLAVALNWRPVPFIAAAILVELCFGVVSQGLGGIFYTNSATDPGTAPVMILLALVMYSLVPLGGRGARRRPLLLAAPLLAVAAVGVTATAIAQTPGRTVQQVIASTPFAGATISPPVAEPTFTLRSYLGQPVALNQYAARDEAVLLTFLGSHCGLCTGVAAELRGALNAMPASVQRRVQVVAISLDPRDTEHSVAAFLSRTGLAGRIQYLVGSAAQLAPIWSSFGISGSYPSPNQLFEANSDTIMYGISAEGGVMTRYSADFSPSLLIHDVKLLERL